MKNFFEPKSVAVIGASGNSEKVGYGIMKNMRRFNGNVYPVNLHEEYILGFKCHKSVLDIDDKIDLAVIAVPAQAVAGVLNECGRKKIRNTIIISAGFSEIGNIKGEEKLKDIAKKYRIRVLGPNNFGTVNPYAGLDTSFSFETPDKGEIAFISQSGALWAALSVWSKGKIGFSKFASLGNMIDVDFADLISYFNTDVETKSIICYVERIEDGIHFMDVCRKSKKPIIVVKAGKTDAGVRAAMSHTGSLAGNFEIYKTAFRQCGVYVADTITSAFDKAIFLGCQKITGKKTVIITNGGGLGVLTADYCAEAGLDVVKLPDRFVKTLDIPKNWSHNNPIDVVGDANWDRYKIVFEHLLRNKSFYDNVVMVLLQQATIDIDKTINEIVNFKEKSGKAVVCCFMGGARLEYAGKVLTSKGIPCFFEPERAVSVLK